MAARPSANTRVFAPSPATMVEKRTKNAPTRNRQNAHSPYVSVYMLGKTGIVSSPSGFFPGR